MAEYIIKTKNKKEEKVVEAFLSGLNINFYTAAQEASFQFLPYEEDNKRVKPVNQWLYPEVAWIQVSSAIREFCK